MGTPIHILSEINGEVRKAICANCGLVNISKAGIRKNGNIQWKCAVGRRQEKNKRKSPYRRRHLKTYCETCGFVAVNKCQLDLDHIDGNHKNNNPSNFQTLCANCHRLKAYINKEWIK